MRLATYVAALILFFVASPPTDGKPASRKRKAAYRAGRFQVGDAARAREQNFVLPHNYGADTRHVL